MTHTDNYIIWVSYHNDSLVNEYNLVEDDHHKLFPTHKTPDKININALNPVWSEMVTMWYVWKNNIKSDYIGFEHYRRHLDIKKLPLKGQCQVFHVMNIMNPGISIANFYGIYHRRDDLDLMLDILDEKYGKNNKYTTYIRTSHSMICNCTFFMKWENFVELADFLFPLLEEFTKRCGITETSPEKQFLQWKERTRSLFNVNVVYQTRVVSFIAERLISAWIENNMVYYV